jgi:hypothetical protein
MSVSVHQELRITAALLVAVGLMLSSALTVGPPATAQPGSASGTVVVSGP